jgi:hypothetical protein
VCVLLAPELLLNYLTFQSFKYERT